MPILSCHDPAALNYQRPSSGHVSAPWACQYAYIGCTDSLASNYVPWATADAPALCQYGGCTDAAAVNFDRRATFNDGTCVYPKYGCMDPNAATFHPRYDASCAFAFPPPLLPPVTSP